MIFSLASAALAVSDIPWSGPIGKLSIFKLDKVMVKLEPIPDLGNET